MDNILNINKKSAIDKLNMLSDEIFKSNSINCKFDNHSANVNGMTVMDIHNNAYKVIIGTGRINKTKISLPFKKSTIPDTEFAKVVINMYHEHMHCIQKNQIFKQEHPDENSMNQMIQEIACMYSHDYYLDGSNYRFNANEIQAEQLESIIVDIVNEKAHMASYFIKDKQYASVDEILSAFDDAYDKSFMETRYYPVNIPLENTKDPVRRYIISHTDTKAAYLNCLSNDDIPRGLKQDRCIASVCMKLYPAIEKNYPGLQDTDLSYETCITRPYLIETGQTGHAANSKIIRSDTVNELLSGIQMPEKDTKEINDEYNP